ncbi:hypothetical protein [Thermotoga sp. KOL6]|uniref:hypothetical protein n=1 Tax=Thermotoga sp. KOL6 TaxID=126741 RepID=UPI000C772A12|nr:hypothetical protein [Thermotoga sp. KOL6]PLV59866.1 hypothetical protein AS005_00770 [Thermotoga sp. KOL6]
MTLYESVRLGDLYYFKILTEKFVEEKYAKKRINLPRKELMRVFHKALREMNNKKFKQEKSLN